MINEEKFLRAKPFPLIPGHEFSGEIIDMEKICLDTSRRCLL